MRYWNIVLVLGQLSLAYVSSAASMEDLTALGRESRERTDNLAADFTGESKKTGKKKFKFFRRHPKKRSLDGIDDSSLEKTPGLLTESKSVDDLSTPEKNHHWKHFKHSAGKKMNQLFAKLGRKKNEQSSVVSEEKTNVELPAVSQLLATRSPKKRALADDSENSAAIRQPESDMQFEAKDDYPCTEDGDPSAGALPNDMSQDLANRVREYLETGDSFVILRTEDSKSEPEMPKMGDPTNTNRPPTSNSPLRWTPSGRRLQPIDEEGLRGATGTDEEQEEFEAPGVTQTSEVPEEMEASGETETSEVPEEVEAPGVTGTDEEPEVTKWSEASGVTGTDEGSEEFEATESLPRSDSDEEAFSQSEYEELNKSFEYIDNLDD